MATIKLTFFQECEEQLVELEAGLLEMNEGNADSETVNAVFRAVHSIKGGAGAFKLDDLVRFAHIFETTLDQVRSGSLAPTPEVMKTVLRAADILADLVAAARDGTQVDEATWIPVLDEFRALSGGSEEANAEAVEPLDFQPTLMTFDDLDLPEAAPAERRQNFAIRFKPKRELYANANEATVLLRELGRLGDMTVACDASALPLLADLEPDGAYFVWTIELETAKDEAAVREIFEFVDGDCELSIEAGTNAAPTQSDVAALIEKVQIELNAEPYPPEAVQAAPAGKPPAPPRALETREPAHEPPAPPPAKTETAKNEVAPPAATIRVEFERVDRLINLVGELVINQAMLSQRIIEAGFASASAVTVGLDELEQLTREIQESVMAIRAQPVKSLFQRMSRIVREVADATSKSARLKTEGEGTEIDKTVVERLADPLTHLIRNAIDHGLEGPEERVAAGKPLDGVVRLSAAHRSGRVVIEVEDDGAGINRARVRDVAVRKGLIPAEAQLNDSEIDNLIFLPGFSTVATVSSISGRGVGMDVVKRSIQALGGRISIASRPGKGSTFTMSLPLTLAVLDGMVVSTSGQTLVVPLTAIVETLRPKAGDVHALGAGAHVLAIRDSFVPLIDVGRALGFRTTPSDPLNSVIILIETEGSARNALLVDAIQDQRQVVIKSLEANYCHVPDIAAATILGDGRVALILDVDELVARSRGDVAPSGLEFAEAG
ncbi:MAG: chemotaxis protein CheA [Roseiarcus sp.]|jgi:two-component system chemotaxis sensor kinase CheA